MKRILFILLLFPLIASAQIGRFPFYRAPVVAAPSGDYPEILDDADMEGWYSAEEENVNLDASDSLLTWPDRTGNEYNLGLEGSYQPWWDADGVHMLDIGDAGAIRYDVEISKPLTVYIVFQQVTWTSQDEILTLNSSGPLFKQYFTGTRCYVYDDANLGPVEPALEEWVVVTIVLNGATSTIRMNDGSEATASCGSNGLVMIKLGGVDIIVKELIIRSVVDDSSEQTTIRDYLNDKYTLY